MAWLVTSRSICPSWWFLLRQMLDTYGYFPTGHFHRVMDYQIWGYPIHFILSKAFQTKPGKLKQHLDPRRTVPCCDYDLGYFFCSHLVFSQHNQGKTTIYQQEKIVVIFVTLPSYLAITNNDIMANSGYSSNRLIWYSRDMCCLFQYSSCSNRRWSPPFVWCHPYFLGTRCCPTCYKLANKSHLLPLPLQLAFKIAINSRMTPVITAPT
jgi:hypothetical protein